MENWIERMNGLRRRLIWITLLGSIAAFAIFTYPTIISIYLLIRPGWLARLLVWIVGFSGLVSIGLVMRPRLEMRRSNARSSARSGRSPSAGPAVSALVFIVLFCQLLAGRWIGYGGWGVRYLELGLLSWLAVCAIMAAAFGIHKRKLAKDPGLRRAVNDERVRANWLRSYRFGFFAICGVSAASKLAEILLGGHTVMFRRIHLPPEPYLILFSALIALLGAFLAYNREARDE